MPADLREADALIAFVDISRILTVRQPPIEVARHLNHFYREVGTATRGAGGQVVKYLGDGALLCFDADHVNTAVLALLELKQDVERWMDSLGWDCRLKVQAHFGPTVVGTYDDGATTFFDVFGRTVNTAATLETAGFTLSAQAFRQLAPETRKRFKKHTLPITYIRVEESHAKVKPAP